MTEPIKPSSAPRHPEAPPLSPGMRQTQQRRLVWQALERLGAHRTAEDIVEEIRRDHPTFPRSTVYRALDALTASGALRAVNLGQGATCYELADEDHQHAVCQVCHGVMHLEDQLLRELEAHLEESHHFTPLHSEVLVVGVCAGCSAGGSLAASTDPAIRRKNLDHVHYEGQSRNPTSS